MEAIKGEDQQSIKVCLRCALFMFHLFVFLSCGSSEDEGKAEPLSTGRLQAISFVTPSVIAVSDSAYSGGDWAEGRILLVDIVQKKRLGAWFSSLANPQALYYDAGQLTALSSGILTLGNMPQGSWSNLSVLKYAENQLSIIQDTFIYGEPKGAYLVDFISSSDLSEDHHLWEMSSGIDGVLWQMTRKESRTKLTARRFAPQERLSLSAIAKWRSYTLIVEFNQDRLYIFDASGHLLPCSPELGQYEGVMEGAQTPVVDGDRLWISFGLSGQLSHINLDTLELQNSTCSIDELIYAPPLGQVPNDLIVRDDQVFVLHSAESALWTYDIKTGQRIEQRMLPPQTNPWHMAISPDGQTIAITEWMRGGVTLINLGRTGELTQLSPSLFAPPTEPYCALPLELKSGSDGKEALIVNQQGLILTWEPLESLQETESHSLQNAPQLALSFAVDSGAASFEYRTVVGEPWRPLTTHNERQLAILTPSMESDRVRSLTIDASLLFENPLGIFFQDDQSLPLNISDDPCQLFLPKNQSLLFSLPNEGNTSRTHDDAGRRSLYQLRIKSVHPNQTLTLNGAAYRRW